MADIRYTGNAEVVAQVDKFTPADPNTDDIYYLTITGVDGQTAVISFTVGATETVAAVCAGLVAAWNASTDSMVSAITAADETTYITLTADTEGEAFSVASSVFDGEGGATPTIPRVVVTANAGPKDWSSADNWSGGAVPGGAASQDVYIEGATLKYGLDQSGIANALDSLNTTRSQIGSNPAYGYAPSYLKIKATAINIGRHDGPGTVSQLAPVNIDAGSTETTITVYDGGSNSTLPAVRLLTNNAASKIIGHKGKTGVASGAGETTTVASIIEGYINQVNTDAEVYIGSGVTVTTISKTGGKMTLKAAATTVTNEGGTLQTEGSGAITTLNTKGGTVISNSTGTIGTLNGTGGLTDFTKSAAPRTVTSVKLEAGATLKRDPNVVTFTNEVASDNPVTLTASAA